MTQTYVYIAAGDVIKSVELLGSSAPVDVTPALEATIRADIAHQRNKRQSHE